MILLFTYFYCWKIKVLSLELQLKKSVVLDVGISQVSKNKYMDIKLNHTHTVSLTEHMKV